MEQTQNILLVFACTQGHMCHTDVHIPHCFTYIQQAQSIPDSHLLLGDGPLRIPCKSLCVFPGLFFLAGSELQYCLPSPNNASESSAQLLSSSILDLQSIICTQLSRYLNSKGRLKVRFTLTSRTLSHINALITPDTLSKFKVKFLHPFSGSQQDRYSDIN